MSRWTPYGNACRVISGSTRTVVGGPVRQKDRLAEYNHPTTMSLALSLAWGGFADAEDPESYLQLAVWLGRLGCGYGLALAYLARVLDVEGNIDSRLESVLAEVR